MNRIRLLAAGMLAAGLLAIAVGGSFFMAGRIAGRPVKGAEEYLQDAQFYMDNGEYYKAIVCCEAVLKEEPDSREALDGLAGAYYRQSDSTGEWEARSRISELAPEDLDNQVRMVELMIQQGRLDEAKQRTEELMEANDSADLNALYREMNIEAPAFSLASGSYDDYQLLQLTNTYDNAVVRYTIDGSEPGPNSPAYSDGIVLSYPTITLRAKAIGYLGYESPEVQLDFSITKPAEAVPIRNSSTLQRLASSVLGRHWNDVGYDYEFAQIRELYLLGEYRIDEEELEAVFYESGYSQYSSMYSEWGDFDLSFAPYMPFLKTLAVGYQKQLDLAPLASLRCIENLSLLNNNIVDISPLAGLTSLKRLALGWNHIQDVSPLAGLQSLEFLGLWNNDIYDVSSLSGLGGLTYFDISHNGVSDVSCAASMPNLSELWINDNQITDLSPIDSCSRLVVLMQGNNPIADYGTVQERSAQLYKTDLE